VSLVLDAGALVGIDRRDRIVLGLLRLAEREKRPLVTSAAVVAQVWRNGSRQANLARTLAGVRIEALSSDIGWQLGVLLGRCGGADVVDAHIASLAAPGDVVLTSDPGDLDRLLGARGVVAEVHRI
jgi:hypothetical protein